MFPFLDTSSALLLLSLSLLITNHYSYFYYCYYDCLVVLVLLLHIPNHITNHITLIFLNTLNLQ